MKLTIEGTKEEFLGILADIQGKERSQKNIVTTAEYGYREEKSICHNRDCKQSTFPTIGWQDRERVMC